MSKRVSSGDPLEIRAQDWNRLLDVADAFGLRGLRTAPPASLSLPGSFILVRNASPIDLDQYRVVIPTTPVVTPLEDENVFRRGVAMNCRLPDPSTDQGRFVVLAVPLKVGEIGPAFAAGWFACRLDVSDDTIAWKFADVHSDVNQAHLWLEAKSGGGSEIFWRQGGTGVQWAVLRFGSPLSLASVEEICPDVPLGS